MHNIVQESINSETPKRFEMEFATLRNIFEVVDTHPNWNRVILSEIFVSGELHWTIIKDHRKLPWYHKYPGHVRIAIKNWRERGTCPSFEECQFHYVFFRSWNNCRNISIMIEYARTYVISTITRYNKIHKDMQHSVRTSPRPRHIRLARGKRVLGRNSRMKMHNV